jgi:hypothetical protein
MRKASKPQWLGGGIVENIKVSQRRHVKRRSVISYVARQPERAQVGKFADEVHGWNHQALVEDEQREAVAAVLPIPLNMRD